ncbi:hypothetical protein BV20DRAFT_1119694 [Pilatotrama ljubarskyi]|nr:hypothetical protein BV20DRAFT_1119694 [Pilatotrama ljubarskyi]
MKRVFSYRALVGAETNVTEPSRAFFGDTEREDTPGDMPTVDSPFMGKVDGEHAKRASQVELPPELLGKIILETWLDIPLFDPLHRWELFSRLSLVSHRFRDLALWSSTRHVRILAHSSMDVAAYRSIGRQCLATTQHHPQATLASHGFLDSLFRYSTVHLDVTYATYWSWRDRDRWLKDDISPGRPDDVYGVHFDLFAGPFGEYTYPHPERRESEYAAWLTRRQRDRLSGWFADLLDVVPACAAVVIEADERIEPFGVRAYSTLLEALWWWTSLESVHMRVVPGLPSFSAEMTGSMGGPSPPLPPLASVRRVWLERHPACTCHKRTELGDGHLEECIIRRMLLPFPELRRLGLQGSLSPECAIGIEVPPGVEVVHESAVPEEDDITPLEEHEMIARFTFGRRAPPPLWTARLNIAWSDALWETVDPDGLRFRSSGVEWMEVW